MAQLVMRFAGATPSFAVEPNPNGQAPLLFEAPKDGVFVPRLGGQDLVRLAAFVEAVGLTIEAFHIADFSLRRLSPEDEEEVSEEVLSALRENGVRAALDLLDTDLDHYVIVGVRVVDKHLHTATLWRHGVYAADGPSELLGILSRAWVELLLS